MARGVITPLSAVTLDAVAALIEALADVEDVEWAVLPWAWYFEEHPEIEDCRVAVDWWCSKAQEADVMPGCVRPPDTTPLQHRILTRSCSPRTAGTSF